MSKKRYLALGDSYTIGEGLPANENFPNQLVQLANEAGIAFETPEVIAVTGWTTEELQVAIEERKPSGQYDLVSLLIGVNNQYRGRDVDTFKTEFSALLDQAIAFAGHDFKKVIVVSIPDWGHTPFAKSKDFDEAKVAMEIADYNAAKQEITLTKGVRFLDITALTKRLAQNDSSYLIADELHYSAKLYQEWAECLLPLVQQLDR